jgi:dynein heavy chain
MNAAAQANALLDKAVSVLPKVPAVMTPELMNTRLRTVEEVAAFFKHFEDEGQETPFRFVYCARVDTGLEFRPYDVVVVARGEQPTEHFVVSPTAVVHVQPSSLSEVTMLYDWIRQSKQFDAICKLTFFRNYLILKHLRKWRRNVSVQKFHLARTRLAKRFFLSKATFAKPTMEVRRLAFALRLVQPNTTMGRIPAPALTAKDPPNVSPEDARLQQALLQGATYPMRLVHYPEQRPQWGYTAEAFLETQRQHFNRVSTLFHRILEAITRAISNVAERVAAQAVVPDMSTFEELEKHLSQGSSVGNAVGTVANRHREHERQVRKRDLKRRIVEYDLLQPWVRLLDVIVSNELFVNATTTFKHFGKHLDLPAQGLLTQLKVAFEVAPVFKDDDPIQFVPNEHDFRSFLLGFVHETVDRMSRITRLVDVKDIRQHFFQTPDVKALTAMLDQHTPFHDVLKHLEQIAARDYADAADKSRVYEPCRAVLHFLTREWPETHVQWQQRVQEKVGSENLLTEGDIRKAINKVKRMQQQDLLKMASRSVGALCLYINPLVTEFNSKLDAVLSDIKASLLLLAQRRVTELAKDLEANIALLKHPGEDLRNFAEWIERMNQVDAASKQLLLDCAEVDALYVLAEDSHFEFSQLHKDKRDRTVGHGKGGELPLRLQLTDAIDNAKGHRDARQEAMRDSLQNAVQDTTGVLESLTNDLRHGEYREATHSSSLIMTKLAGVNNTLHSIKVKQQTLDHYAELLGVERPPWREMDVANKEYESKHELWSTVAAWDEKRSYWNRTPVAQLEGQKLKDEMTELFQKAHKLNKLHDDNVSARLLNAVSSEKTHLVVMSELCNPALKEEHWLKIFDGMNKRLPPAEARTLETLRTFGAYEQVELITSVSSVATGEFTLLNQVNKIAAIWESTPFVIAKNKGSGGKADQPILGGLDEVMLMLEDNQVQIQTCLASRYVGGIKRLVEDWETKLRTIGDVLDEWLNVQKSWLYLEFIFSSDDIKKQLPEESKLFGTVDKTYRTLMNNAVDVNIIATVCCQENLLENLKIASENLDRIQKRLEDYLETKRVAFPRFYFLSNDELLSILSDVRNPMAVQPHLQKCFDNIKELNFDTSTIISAMRSQDGEVVPFSDKIKVAGNVEHWLNDIEAMMRRTLYDITKAAHTSYPDQKRTEWYFNYPAQVVGCVDQIVWTAELEDVWRRMGKGEATALVDYMEFYKRQLLDTVALVKGTLTSHQRMVCCTLIVVDVHARDVVQSLIDDNCSTTVDFNWLKQLRYYWEADDSNRFDCHIRHSAAHVLYGYEYLGNQLRLVITPLTERAFLTCTGALHMYQGAAPQGPAGTGKTESVKDLGKALARQVVVFNCSDGLNYKMMSQMFAGLAQAGAWACFDEFNRIEIEVLSVVAQQMLEITTAIAAQQSTMLFDGHNIRLNKNFGVFITMNPGYAGRTELPDNLKALFRPICMMIPDYALIAEIMFYSEGFNDAKPLAQKMVKLYSLSSQQLSKQDHYDFGMRAVKSILVMAGALKRAEPNNPEDMILIRAMRDSNVPKFLRDDTTLFLALISDLFPSVDIREVVNADLQKETRETLVRNGCQVVDGFVDKILQLYETMVVRHGVMLVGQTMTGKTRAATTLAEALSTLHKNGIEASHEAHTRFFFAATIHRLNPKSITMSEMYGDINRVTREWQDGVLSNIVRDLVRRTTPDRHWVTFDGPVDAIWIENMNTVLDDNKLLCLVNGERIKIPDIISIMFEVQDLRHASPATVSRCGMVFMEAYYLAGGWRPLAKTFSERIVAEGGKLGQRWQHDELMALLDSVIPKSLTMYRTELHEYIADGGRSTRDEPAHPAAELHLEH